MARAQESIDGKCPRKKIGALYLASGSFLSLLAAAWPPASLALVWPAGALLWVGLAYACLGPRAFAKRKGRLHLACRLLLAPYLAGAALSLRFQTRREPPCGEILPGLVIGRRLNRTEAKQAVGEGIGAVLDLTAEFSEAAPFRSLPYLDLQILDLTAPSLAQLQRGMAFIRAHQGAGKLYIHCALGYGRSACFAVAWALECGAAAGLDEALALVRAARPRARLNSAQRAVLASFHCALLRQRRHNPRTTEPCYPQVPQKNVSRGSVRAMPAWLC